MLKLLDSQARAIGRRTISTFPIVESLFRNVRSEYLRTHIHLRTASRNCFRAAPIDPFAIYWVDPEEINDVATAIEWPRYERLGVVLDGDWDEPDISFTETDIYQSFERHFEDGVPWEDTEFFDRVASSIARGNTPWGCDSQSALHDRCEQLDALYANIEAHGFKTQAQLMADESVDTAATNRTTEFERFLYDEVAIDIGRDGSLLFSDGRNRLAIAKILGVDEIPVVVLLRHEGWQSFRDQIAAHIHTHGSAPSIANSHPDLASINDELSH